MGVLERVKITGDLCKGTHDLYLKAFKSTATSIKKRVESILNKGVSVKALAQAIDEGSNLIMADDGKFLRLLPSDLKRIDDFKTFTFNTCVFTYSKELQTLAYLKVFKEEFDKIKKEREKKQLI